MSHETDKELADRLDADKRIRNHGGTWKTCHRCKGAGYDFPHSGILPCFVCNGRGGEWEFPMMRSFSPPTNDEQYVLMASGVSTVPIEFCQQLPSEAQKILNAEFWNLI